MVAEQQAESKVKRVWILGAGFSRPLGGPLLADLFTMRGWRRLQGQFWTFSNPKDAIVKEAALRVVYALYHWGKGYPGRTLFGKQHVQVGEDLFEHAEAFIVWLGRVPSDTLRIHVEEALKGQADLESFIANLDTLFEDYHRRGPRAETLRHKKLQECLLDASRRLLAFECCAFLKELEDRKEQEPFTPYRAWAKHLTEADVLIS